VLVAGQTALLTSACLYFGMLFARSRPTLAGALLALLVAKPQLGLAVPAALIGLAAPSAFLRTAIFAILYVLASAAVLGLEPWVLFLKVTLPQQTHVLSGLVALIPEPAGMTILQQAAGSTGVTALVKEPMKLTLSQFMSSAGFGSVAIAVHWSIALVVLTTLVMALRAETNVNIRFLLIALTTVIVSPYLLGYELALLAIAVGLVTLDPRAIARLGASRVTGLAAVVTVGCAVAIICSAVFDTLNVTALLLCAAYAWVIVPYLTPAGGVWRTTGTMSLHHRST
jgi:Glycosyltransferase family 87